MARIESSSKEALEEKLDRLEEQLKRSRRKVFGCFNCLLYGALLLIVGVGLVAYAAAKSGLAQVPLMTARYYEEPQPRAVVVPASDESGAQLAASIQDQTRAAFAAGAATAPATVRLSEGFLTALLQDQLADEEVQQLQVDVTTESIELFVERGTVILTIDATPVFRDGKLDFALQRVALGSLELPKMLGRMMLNSTAGTALNGMQATLAGLGTITDVRLGEGGVDVDLTVHKATRIFNVFK